MDLRRVLDVVTDTASSAIGALTSSHQVAIISGVLGVIRGINRAVTVDIAEKDARVFFAMNTGHADRIAISEASLLGIANDHRRGWGLAEITLTELRASLYTLEQIHCVSRTPEIPDQWRIVESFRVREKAGV